MSFRAAALAAFAVTACASSPLPAVVHGAAAPASSAPASASSPTCAPASTSPSSSAPLLGLYLPPSQAGGFATCLDPQSPALRALVKRPRWELTDTVPAGALADDVRDFLAFMKKAYAGYPELAQDPRFDVERYFATWDSFLRRAGDTVTFEQGVLQPLIGLRRAHSDNHFSVGGWGVRLVGRPELAVAEYQAHRTMTREALAACTFGGDAQPMTGTLRVAREISASGVADLVTFSARGGADAIVGRCGGDDVRFERRASSATWTSDNDPAYEWRVAGDATVIVVRRLYGSPDDEKKLARLAEDYDLYRKKPTIVFDFRGNGGGNDGYVYQWIDRAVRGPWRPAYFEVKVTGAALPCGDWNAMVMQQLEYDRGDAPDAVAERDGFLAKALAQLDTTGVETADLSDNFSHAKAPYGGRVFVLVDRNSGSSGESGPDMLRAAMGATLVGERTAGYLEYGNVRPWVMPRTGLVWGLGSKRNHYGTPVEAVGLPTEVYLAPELLEKPVEELVPLLEALPVRARSR